MNAPSFATTVRFVEIGAIGARVSLDVLGAPDGPPISFAVADDIPPLQLSAPIYLNRPNVAHIFPSGPVTRHARIVCSVRNGFMFSPFGAIVLADGSIVRESMVHTDSEALSFTYAHFQSQFPGRHIMWDTAERSFLSFNTYSTNNYFHFLLDALGQLHWRDRLPSVAMAPMVISGYAPDAVKTLPFVDGAYERGGIFDQMLQPFDGTLMLCRHVVFPARDTGANPAKVAELRRLMGVADRPRGTKRLYITRPGAGRRRLLNDAALAVRLEKRGFIALDPGALSFEEQVETFASAAIVVGAHGAALTNAVFMPPGGALVELTHTSRVVWTFHEVAGASNLAYACVVGAPASATDHALFVDFTVDPDEVDAAVDAALGSVGQ